MAPHTLTTAADRIEARERAGSAVPPRGPAAAGAGRARFRTGRFASGNTGSADSVSSTGAAGPAPEQAADAKQAALNAVGGPWGIAASAVPTVVFAAAVAFVPLPISIGIAIAVALVIAGVQLRRGQSLSSAAGGLIGVAAAGGVSAATGSAGGFFLIGIWAALAIGAAALASQLMGRPATGVVWNAVHGGAHPWREDRPALIAHHIATLAVTLMCAARFGVQQWLYLADSTGWLAVADTALGFPLTGLVAVVVAWAFRRSTKRLVKSAGPPAAEQA